MPQISKADLTNKVYLVMVWTFTVSLEVNDDKRQSIQYKDL